MNDSKRNLVLTGFMGTGKSTIGRLVAASLDRPLIDMDAVIEKRTGKSIPQIFGTQGETAFRQMERNLCEELAGQSGLVIATGGGTLVDPINRAMMLKSGVVICLTAAPEVLLDRLHSDDNRPLLQTGDPAARIRRLLEARAESYAALPYHVDTTHLSPPAAAEAVLELWQRQST